jgi:arginine-tRNA-protein transferase
LTPEFYQSLLDRSWRRSGDLLYRPNPRDSCCPHYTIRLDTDQFVPTKDQRQTVNRFNKHILGDQYARESARLHPRSRAEAKRRDNTFDLVERIHEAESAFLEPEPRPKHRLTVELEDDSFTEEKYRIFENYQSSVHKEKPEEVSRSRFTKFLCDSPVRRRTVASESGRSLRLGSFHHCYRIDGELVAVGVLDLLPGGVSSVYFFYHESIHKLVPGKLGALWEIALAREAGYRWWYPGYYIHGCPKMRYKMDYAPQSILDPDTHAWVPLDSRVLDILSKPYYQSISAQAPSESPEAEAPSSPASPPDEPASASPSDEEDDYGDEDLFSQEVPGIPSLDAMAEVDLDDIPLRLDSRGPVYKISDLVMWQEAEIGERLSLKRSVAELVAAVGVELLDRFCLDYVH